MIDWDRVRELRSEIGPEDFAEVAAMFLEEADETVARMSARAGAKAIESDLHFLKGSALNLGFRQLSALCQDGEQRAAAGDTAVDLAAVRICYFASRTEFQNKLDRHFAA